MTEMFKTFLSGAKAGKICSDVRLENLKQYNGVSLHSAKDSKITVEV